jgi:large subunit ribosomal protein L23
MANILVKPVITEKATMLSEKRNQFAFIVDRNANKLQIKKAVTAMFNVTVEEVNTSILPGKLKTKNTKKGVVSGMKPARKKAIVTLKEGDKIDFYSL